MRIEEKIEKYLQEEGFIKDKMKQRYAKKVEEIDKQIASLRDKIKQLQVAIEPSWQKLKTAKDGPETNNLKDKIQVSRKKEKELDAMLSKLKDERSKWSQKRIKAEDND